MNKNYTKESLYKNHFYLFYKHIFGAENSNSYNSNLETYLIDIDNFDILDKLKIKDIEKSFIYDSKLLVNNSILSLYPNIHTSRINLDYLKNRYYNKNILTNIERKCLSKVSSKASNKELNVGKKISNSILLKFKIRWIF